MGFAYFIWNAKPLVEQMSLPILVNDRAVFSPSFSVFFWQNELAGGLR